MDIYQIKVNRNNFIFCTKDIWNKDFDDNDIFTDTYIYGDDTIVEVINKIKIAIINSDSEYSDFNELYGYLSTDKWNYYSDYKIHEFETLVNNNNSLDNTFYERINKNLNVDGKLENTENNNLVIGYYTRNLENNYIYYINDIYFENELITNRKLLENEYNNPINTYKTYDNS